MWKHTHTHTSCILFIYFIIIKIKTLQNKKLLKVTKNKKFRKKVIFQEPYFIYSHQSSACLQIHNSQIQSTARKSLSDLRSPAASNVPVIMHNPWLHFWGFVGRSKHSFLQSVTDSLWCFSFKKCHSRIKPRQTVGIRKVALKSDLKLNEKVILWFVNWTSQSFDHMISVSPYLQPRTLARRPSFNASPQCTASPSCGCATRIPTAPTARTRPTAVSRSPSPLITSRSSSPSINILVKIPREKFQLVWTPKIFHLL